VGISEWWQELEVPSSDLSFELELKKTLLGKASDRNHSDEWICNKEFRIQRKPNESMKGV
jgi:hypothetical protein